MSEKKPQPRHDRLVDQYREIGPAVLVAALMSAARHGGKARNDNRRHSILSVRKAG